jgi:hypothetical protein
MGCREFLTSALFVWPPGFPLQHNVSQTEQLRAAMLHNLSAAHMVFNRFVPEQDETYD